MITVVTVCVLSYLIGAVPWSWLWARRAGLDLRTVGSGNLGATNAYRALGARGALPVLLLDVAKGAVAPLVCARLRIDQPLVSPASLAALAGLSAILGHIFPIYLRFRGGKGIATAAGAFLVLAPVACLSAFVVFLIALLATRGIVSVGSLAAALALPIVILAENAWRQTPQPALVAVATVVAVVVWSKHTANLRRLAAGTEKRLFDRASTLQGRSR
jgi:glycerol-3-phosphate acyltransferase PlsY